MFSTLPFDVVQHALFFLSHREIIALLDLPLSRDFVEHFGSPTAQVWKNTAQLQPWSLSTQASTSDPRQLCHQIDALERALASPESDSSLTMDYWLCQLSQLRHVVHVQSDLWTHVSHLNEVESNRMAFRQSAGLKVLLEVLELYVGHADIQASVCLALVTTLRPLGKAEGSNFHQNDLNVTDSESLTSLANEDEEVMGQGVALILSMMTAHRTNARVQTNGCWALVNIALDPRQKRALLAQDAVGIISEALRGHQDVASVTFRGLFALVNLVASPDVKVPLDFVELVLVAMLRFSSDETIVKLGLMTLGNYLLGQQRRQEPRLDLTNVVDRLVEIVQEYAPGHVLQEMVQKTSDRIHRQSALRREIII